VIERSPASLERVQLPNLHHSYTILHHFDVISKKKANFLENGSYNLLQILFPTGPNHELSGTPRGFAPKIFLAEVMVAERRPVKLHHFTPFDTNLGFGALGAR